MPSVHLGVTQFISNMSECIYQGKLPATYTTSSLGARFVEQLQDSVDNEHHVKAVFNAVGAVAFTFFQTFAQILDHGQRALYHVIQLEFSKVFTDLERAFVDLISNGLFVGYGMVLTALSVVSISKLELLKSATTISKKVQISQLKHSLTLHTTKIKNLKAQIKALKKEAEES